MTVQAPEYTPEAGQSGLYTLGVPVNVEDILRGSQQVSLKGASRSSKILPFHRMTQGSHLTMAKG